MSSDLKVDNLFRTVKEFQQEKACLQHKLSSLRNTRANLEVGVRSTAAKRKQTNAVNSKMRETLKVAQAKVAKTQAQMETLQRDVEQKRERVAQLNKEISGERQRGMDQIFRLEEKLAQLAMKFQNARHFYDESSLCNDLHTYENDIQLLRNDEENKSDQVHELLQQFQKLQVEQDVTTELAELTGIPAQLQKDMFDMFTEENTQADQQLKLAWDAADQLEKKLSEFNK